MELPSRSRTKSTVAIVKNLDKIKYYFAGKKGRHCSDTSSTSISISTRAMQNIIERLRLKANRESISKNYYWVWKNFNQFYVKLDVKPQTWEERLILYVGFLISNDKKSSTIRSYISAIKAVLLEDGVELSENRYLITSLTKACRLVNDKVKTRLPIQRGMVNLLLKGVERLFLFNKNQPYLATLYKALFSTAYFSLFRIGELTSGTHPIAATDVRMGRNKNKVLFILRTSKTHWKDVKPQMVKIASSGNAKEKRFCPFRILRNYITVRGKSKLPNEPFFVFSDKTPVTPAAARKVFKTVLEEQGFDPQFYGFHSFRIGRATDLLKASVKISKIKKLGMWRSNIIYEYLR